MTKAEHLERLRERIHQAHAALQLSPLDTTLARRYSELTAEYEFRAALSDDAQEPVK
jgi:hypothetical protein